MARVGDQADPAELAALLAQLAAARQPAATAPGGGGILEQVIAYFEGKDYANSMQTKPYVIDKANVDDARNWGNLKK